MTEMHTPAKFSSLLPLLPAEKEFARCLAERKSCIVGNGTLPEQRIEFGNGANVVRGEVIRFFAEGGNEENPVPGAVIHLWGAWVSGDLDVTYVNIPHVLRLGSCHFVASVRMQYAECAALYLNGSRLARGLRADGLVAKGVVCLGDGFSAEGEVRLLSAKIGGDLDCAGGKFHNSDGDAFCADGLTTQGNVNLDNGFSAEGEVRLLSAKIGGDLNCEDGKFHNPGGYALSADKLTTTGDVYLRRSFSAEGEVRLLSANIGGDLNCEDGKFHNPGGYALSADKLTTTGDVYLRKDFSAEGEVQLLSANIGGDLDCAGGKFHNSDRDAVSADRLMTKGSVYLRRGFSAEGEVRLLSANIGGDLDCADGKFHNSDRDALSADGLTTKGSVNLNQSFSAEGTVRLLSANIGGNLNCAGGKFYNPGECALNVRGGNINRGVFWQKTTCAGIVNLAYVKTDMLVDDSDSWKSCKVVLDGFVYNRFAGHDNVESRLRWLDNRPDGEEFSLLPYEQAAKVLFGMEHADDAREILLKKERLQTKDGQMHWLQREWRRLWNVFAGYGYRLRYTIAWILGIVAFGAVFFGVAAHHDQIVPHQPAILASAEYQEARKENLPMEAARVAFPVEYPEFTPLAFALDVFIPLFALHQEPFWAPASNMDDDWWKSSILLALFLAALAIFTWLARMFQNWIKSERSDAPGPTGVGFGMALFVSLLGFDFAAGFALVFLDFEIGLWLADWRWLTVWYWIEIAAGWILTSLFLLSITGLLRPRQWSGDKK